MKMHRQVAAGVVSLAVITGLVGCGSSRESYSPEITAETTTAVTTTTVAEKIRSSDEELKPAPEAEATSDSETSSSEAVQTSSFPEEDATPYFTDEQIEIKKAVDKALTVFQTADVEGIFDCTDMDIFYYAAYGKVPSREELLQTFGESGTEFSPIEDSEISWELLNIAPVNESTYTDMYAFLNGGFADLVKKVNNSNEYNLMDNFGSIADFEKIRGIFGITDVYAVQINAEYPEKKDNSVVISSAVESNTCFYVFKIKDNWKLDIPYSTYFMVDKMIAKYESE